jgi:hypothetical protein
MQYMEKKLKPEVEKEIKEGFFEIKKKFSVSNVATGKKEEKEETHVYVSHLCLHNFHPIFCKFALSTVKLILHLGSIIFLTKRQILYTPGVNDNKVYIILFGKLRMADSSG